jgi:sporulation protein YlmC with PRC-barrel domain
LNPALLNGKKVVGTEGYILGEVDGIDVNLNTWQANAFYVSLSDEATAELGLKKPFLSKITVCLPTQLVEAVGEVITLKEPIRNLEDIAERGILVSSTKLKGKRVIAAKGYVVGEVEGFDVDLSNWQVTGLQVGLTDDAATKLGFKRPFLSKVVIIIPSKIVSLVGNFVTLN